MRAASPRALGCLVLTSALAAFACDDARSTPPASEEIAPAGDEAAPTPAGEVAADSAEQVEPKPEAEPEPEPERPAGPSCDQRESKQTCVDYGEHRGAAPPRCVEGVELDEFGCAREAVTGRCTLSATGVVIYSYEGSSVEQAQAECDTIKGVFVTP